MKNKLFLLGFLLLSLSVFSQEAKFKTYSHTELFEMIAAEKDTIFKLKDAIILFDKETDSIFARRYNYESKEVEFIRTDTITINKALDFNNVHFEHLVFSRGLYGGFGHIKFTKAVAFINTSTLVIGNCVFQDKFQIKNTDKDYEGLEWLIKNGFSHKGWIFIDKTKFSKDIHIQYNREDHNLPAGVSITYCDISHSIEHNNSYVFTKHLNFTDFRNNSFHGKGSIRIDANSITRFDVSNNNFFDVSPGFNLSKFIDSDNVTILDNEIGTIASFSADALSPNFVIPWQQLDSKIISPEGYEFYLIELNKVAGGEEYDWFDLYGNDSIENEYFVNKQFIKYKNSYKKEVQLLAKFRRFYESQHDPEDANKVYLALKNLETDRLKFVYKESPSFKTYFKWKVNQFLKIFSDYGTEPSKAIVFSIYVIFIFAFIYFFFPNTWDSHGKNRILDRYRFFFKYMNRKAGIHEVYLEEKKEELLEYDEFKALVESSGKTVPKFFSITALPIYKWAVSGTKLSVSLLRRIDFLEGNWQDLPDKKRLWKKVLLIAAFSIVLVYDVFIKILNALMLSVNTFTTLGFGEIPIKGLPRYLAIIQGFIGWFMLTIFSVSLITQLLK